MDQRYRRILTDLLMDFFMESWVPKLVYYVVCILKLQIISWDET